MLPAVTSTTPAALEPCGHATLVGAVVTLGLRNGEDQPILAYVGHMRVSCFDCGHPFIWLGAPVGDPSDGPCTDLSQQELRAPLRPMVDTDAELSGHGALNLEVWSP